MSFSNKQYEQSLRTLFHSLEETPQRHRLSLHPYLSTKSRAPHRRLFPNRQQPHDANCYPLKQKDNCWLLGDCAYVCEDADHRPITCSLSHQHEVRSEVAFNQFHLLLSKQNLLSTFFCCTENELRQYLVHKDKRSSPCFNSTGFYSLQQTLEKLCTGNIKLPVGKAGAVVVHFSLCRDLNRPPLDTVSDSKDADVFVVFFAIKGGAGTGPPNKRYSRNRRGFHSNMCVRLSMFIDERIIESSHQSKQLEIRLGELQFMQRLLEEECWILFETINVGSRKVGPVDGIRYPLYLSYARDAVSVNLRYQDTRITVPLNGEKKEIVKREWFFPENGKPSNADSLTVGLTQYLHMYTEKEQNAIDDMLNGLDANFELNMLKDTVFVSTARFSSISNGYNLRWKPIDVAQTPVDTCVHSASNFDSSGQSYNTVLIEYDPFELKRIFQGQLTFCESSLKESFSQAFLNFLDDCVSPHIEEFCMAAHRTIRNSKVMRTKFFCEMNYLWTRQQLSEVGACWAHYTRKSVLPIPQWIDDTFIQRCIQAGVIPSKGFVKMVACNLYETGDLGLASHFDDPTRFSPPIISYQPFSDKRLSFGCVDSGMTNPLFCIPMPRGSILVMEKDSFAISKVKHGVRKPDLTSKSGALIFRNIPEEILTKAREYTAQKAKEECRCIFHSTGHGTNIRVKKKSLPETPRVGKRKRNITSPMTTESTHEAKPKRRGKTEP